MDATEARKHGYCQCDLWAPCALCIDLDEAERIALDDGGFEGLIAHIERRDQDGVAHE